MTEISMIAKETLAARYLLRDGNDKVTETPEEMFRRVAHCVAHAEKDWNSYEYWSERFFMRMSHLDFMPNSPTLMNAEKENGQLSACFVLPIQDSMEGIFTTLRDAAIIHQTGGGTGFDFSSLRPEGSMVSNKSGVSTGPLAFCQVYDKATEVIKQGATRRGANMMTLRVDHPDILEFITMKQTEGVMENFNVSVCITNDFMDAVLSGSTYSLKHPFTGIVGELDARQVWDLIAHSAHASGEPGVLFIDRANEQTSFNEPLEATNPCGEQWLPPYGVCNLGSINVSNFVCEDEFDWEALHECTVDAVRFLDNVIDVNHYPLEVVADKAKHYRNIGLGIMGWADALIKIGIPYNSDKAITLGRKLQAAIQRTSHEYSVDLAKMKGVPTGAPFNSPFEWTNPYRRNATLTTVAPTGTISIISGCSSGIEPVFAFEMIRNQLDRTFTDYHPLWKAHIQSGNTYKREAFVQAEDVSPEYHVRMQAAFQENVDNSISKTINLPATATVEDVKEAYKLAWDLGCKGCTVYRDSSRGKGVLEHIKTDNSCCEQPNLLNQEGCITCQNCGVSKCSIA